MERKMIYPFKKFVRNIIIGLCFVMLAFCAMPVYNLISNNVNKPVEAESKTVTFKAYRYNDSGNIEEITTTYNWGATWTQTQHNVAWKNSGGQIIYMTKDGSTKSGRDVANYSLVAPSAKVAGSRTETLYDGESIYAQCENANVGVVGFFKNTKFDASSMVKLGSKLDCSDLGTETTIYILFNGGKDDSKSIDITYKNAYLKVGSYSWQTLNNENFNSVSDILTQGGRIDTLATGSVAIVNYNNHIKFTNLSNDYTARFYDANKNKLGAEIGGIDYYTAWIDSNGYLQLGTAMSKGETDSFIQTNIEATYNKSTFKFTAEISVLYTVATHADKLFSNSDSKVVFNIRDSSDLSFLATEVNSSYMNASIGSNYRVELKNNIYSYGGMPIGIRAGDYAFKGEFVGNGYKIENATLNAYYELNPTHRRGNYSAQTQYTYTYYEPVSPTFGLFGYIDGGKVGNLNLGTVSRAIVTINSPRVDVSWVNTQNRTYGSYSIDTNLTTYDYLIAAGTDAYFGALCGYAQNAEFENINVDNFNIKVKTVGKYCIGGLIGGFVNSTVSNCNITNSANITLSKNEHEDGSTNVTFSTDVDISFGGLVGYASGANNTYTNPTIQNSYVNKVTFEVAGEHCADSSGSPAYRGDYNVGGFVGTLVGTSIQSCSVVSGTIKADKLYYATNLNFGGFVGKAQGTCLTKCYSKVDIKVLGTLDTENQVSGIIKGNNVADFINIGGIVGKYLVNTYNGNTVEVCRYEGSITAEPKNTLDDKALLNDDLTPKTGAFLSRYCMIGGGIGNVESVNANGDFSTGGTICYQYNETFVKNLIVGSSSNLAGHTFVGYFIGNWYGPQLSSIYNKYNIGAIKSIAVYSNNKIYLGVIGANNSDTTVMVRAENFDKSYYIPAPQNDKVLTTGVWGGTIKIRITRAGERDYQNYNYTACWYNGTKLSTSNDVVDALKKGFQYNSQILSGLVSSGLSAPFINVSNYKKIILDYSKVKDKNVTVNGGLGSISEYNNSLLNKIYCSVIPSGNYYTGVTQNQAGVTLPDAYYSINGTTIILQSYNTKPDGSGTSYNKNTNYNYSNFAMAENGTLTLYPIFRTSVTVNSVTAIKVNGKTLNTVASKETVTIGDITYQVACSKVQSSQLYRYEYVVTVLNKPEKTTISASELKSIFGLDLGGHDEKEGINFALVDLANKINDRNLYFVYKFYGSDTQKSKTIDASDNLTTYYLNVYSTFNLQYCDNKSGIYNKVVEGYQFYGDLIKKDSRIGVNFSDCAFIDDKAPIYDDENNALFTPKNIYASSISMAGQNIVEYNSENVTTYKKYYYENSEPKYQQYYAVVYIKHKQDEPELPKTLEVYYYDINGNTTDEPSHVINYESEKISGDSGKITINSYANVFGSCNYAFAYWQVGNNNNLYARPFKEFLINSESVENNRLNLYAKFITDKNNNPIKLTSLVREISTIEDLATLSYKVNYEDGYNSNAKYVLKNNLDMSSVYNFMPIGLTSNRAFNGNFNGGKHTISNLSIKTNFIDGVMLKKDKSSTILTNGADSEKSGIYCGLFGLISFNTFIGEVSDVYLLAISYDTPNIYVGGIAGYTMSPIKNCLVEGEFVKTDTNSKVGGIVGYSSANGKITNCLTKVKSTMSNVYSIVGEAEANIENCFDISNGSVLKGFAYTKSSTVIVKNCYTNYNFNDVYQINNTFGLGIKFIGDDKIYRNIDSFYADMDKTIWTKSDGVNSNNPYLKDVGTVKAKFVIDTVKYLVTEEDYNRFADYVEKNVEDSKLILTKEYFILDSEYSYDNNLKILTCDNGAVFNELSNYNFVNYTNAFGDEFSSDTSEEILKQVWTNNGEEYYLNFENVDITLRVVIATKTNNIDWSYNDNSNGKVILKEIQIKTNEKYVIKNNGIYDSNDTCILDLTLNDELINLMAGYKITGYMLRTNIIQTANGETLLFPYLKIDSTTQTLSYLKNSSDAQLYGFDTEFIASKFNIVSFGNIEESLTPFISLCAILEHGLDKVDYKLNFKDQGGNTLADSVTGNYGDAITMPEIKLPGKNITGWYYEFNGNKVDFNLSTMPELRLSNYNATEIADIWELNLYPKYDTVTYTIKYASAKNVSTIRTISEFISKSQEVNYGIEVKPYNNEQLILSGYILQNFSMTVAQKRLLIDNGINSEDIDALLKDMNSALKNGTTFVYSLACDINLVCGYKAIDYKLNFKDEDGNILKEITGNINAVIDTSDIKIAGKTITGWYYFDESGKKSSFTDTKMPDLSQAKYNAREVSDVWVLTLYPYCDVIAYSIVYKSAVDTSDSVLLGFTPKVQPLYFNDNILPYNDTTNKELKLTGYSLNQFKISESQKAQLIKDEIFNNDEEINAFLTKINKALKNNTTFIYDIESSIELICEYTLTKNRLIFEGVDGQIPSITKNFGEEISLFAGNLSYNGIQKNITSWYYLTSGKQPFNYTTMPDLSFEKYNATRIGDVWELKLYPEYDAVAYTITYASAKNVDTNATITGFTQKTQSAKFEEEITLYNNELSLNGYVLQGFSISDDYKNTLIESGVKSEDIDIFITNINLALLNNKSFTYTLTCPINLVCEYKQLEYKLNFKDKDGTILADSITCHYNEKITLPNVTLVGRNFTGWYYINAYNNEVNFGATTMPELRQSNYNAIEIDGVWELDLYPKFTTVSYNITYASAKNISTNMTISGFTAKIQTVSYEEEVSPYYSKLNLTGYALQSFSISNENKQSLIKAGIKNEDIDALIKNMNLALQNEKTFVYSIASDIKLICEYEKIVEKCKIEVKGNNLVETNIYYKSGTAWTNSGVTTTSDGSSSCNIAKGTAFYLTFKVKPYCRITSITNSAAVTYRNENFKIDPEIPESWSESSKSAVYYTFYQQLFREEYGTFSTTAKCNVTFNVEGDNLLENKYQLTGYSYNSYTTYDITSAKDLAMAFYYKYCNSKYTKLNLKNNIDITGYNLSVSSFKGVFEGNGYSINGLTIIASQSDGQYFINTDGDNSVNINNLVFNNVFIIDGLYNTGKEHNIYFKGIFTNNKTGSILNVYIKNGYMLLGKVKSDGNIGVLINSNSGLLRNCKVNINLNVASINNKIGLIAGTNNFIIEQCEIGGVITVSDTTTYQNIFAICAVDNYSKYVRAILINKMTIRVNDNPISIVHYTNKTADNGYDKANFYKALVDYNYYNYTIDWDYGLKQYFIQAYTDASSTTKRYYLKNVDCQLVKVDVSCEKKVNGVSLKVNGNEYDELSSGSGSIYVYSELSNVLTFRKTEYEEKSLDWNLAIFLNGSNQIDKFGGKSSLSNNVYSDINVSYDNIFDTITTKVQKDCSTYNIKYTYYPKDVDTSVEFRFSTTNPPKFTQDEIEKIKESFEILNNDTNVEFSFTPIYALDGLTVIGYGIKLNNTKYFDNLKLNINLPSFAKIDVIDGLKINGVTKNDSLGKSEYVIEDVLNENTTIAVYLERNAIKLVLDLNKDSLVESEKIDIKFAYDFYSKADNNATVNDDGTLVILIPAENTGSSIVYNTPSIKGVFEYERNGIYYSFDGFIDSNGVGYYDKNLENIKEVTQSTTLYAKWEAVEYTIKVDSLNGEIYYPNSNGYSINDDGATKVFKFNDSVNLPTVKRVSNEKYYTLLGYKLGEKFITNGNTTELIEEYTKLNKNYIDNAIEKVITITPEFSENTYTTTFNASSTIEYNAYIIDENGNRKESVTYENLTISNIDSLVPPKAVKEHHKFIGYKTLDEKYIISYNESENKFEYNASDYDIWLSNNEFYAYYEIDKVNVTIECKDINGATLDVEITNDKGISYTYENNEIKFVVDYNTTNLELIELNILNEGYKFNSYVIGGDEYSLSYVFTNDVTLNIKCEYKIEYITQTGEISIEYINRIQANDNIIIEKDESGNYTFYSTSKTIELPAETEVIKEGYNLVGYTTNGENITELNITKPCSVIFVYAIKEYTITIKNDSYTTIKSNHGSFGITKVTDIVNGKELTVRHGSNLTDIIENVIILNLPTGEKLEKYTFNNNDIPEDLKVTENGELKAITYKLNYVINIYEKESLSSEYSLTATRTGYYNDILEVYTPKENVGFRFNNFSLNEEKSTPNFVLPSNMPALEKEYSSYSTYDETTKTYTLNVYAHYMSTVTITIKYQDYQNSQELEYNLLNKNCLDIYSYKANGNKISFVVDKNTTNLVLPEVELTTSGYTFVGYIVGTNAYDSSHVFTDDTEILVKCKYKVTLLAGSGEISPLYTSSLKELNANIDGTNNTYTFNQERSSLILPTSEQVTNEGYDLVGFTQDGISFGLNESIIITKPTTITFNYEIIKLTVKLTGENCIIPQAEKSNNFILSGSYSVVNNTATFKVNYGTKVKDILTDLNDPTCKNGYSFTGYLYNGNEITNRDEIIKNDDLLEVTTILNTYKIIINKQDGTTKEYIGKYNDSLDPYTDRVIGNYYGNYRYNGLSYISDEMAEFTMPSVMPDLSRETPYSNYAVKTADYTYELNVYENYTDIVYVTINYKDYQNNEQLSYQVDNYNNVTNLENYGKTNEKITFVVEKGTKNITLPEVSVKTEGYNFVSYMVGATEYTTDYVFNADTEILVKCAYLVKLYTKGGVLSDSYIQELENTNLVTLNTETYGYSFVTENGTFTLPDKDSVTKTGFNLVKFEGDVDITDIENVNARKVNVTKPMNISFTYNEVVLTLTLTATDCYAPNKADLSVDKINGYKLVDDKTLEIYVIYGINVKSVINALGKITTDKGYSFKKYTFNGNGILDSDIVTKNGTIEAIGVQNTYTIEIYEKDNLDTPAYIQENKHYNDVLDEYIPNKINGYRYDCLSLKQDSLVKIDMPSYMPALEKDYAEYYEEISEFNYRLKIYAKYVETVQVTIKYQDKDNGQDLGYEIITNNCLDSYTYETNGNEITFRVDKNSKGIILPVVNISTEGYTFVNYMVGENVYKTSYTFTEDTIILVKCSYQVTFNAKGGTITDSYIQKNGLSKQVINEENIYMSKVTNGEISLPTNSQVSWSGYNLIGYTQDETIDIVLNGKANITKPTKIVFNYEYALREITLTGANCVISETNSSDFIYDYVVKNNVATFKVRYDRKVNDIIKALTEPLIYNGYAFKGYLFNGKSITDEDRVTVDSKLEVVTSLNTYIIEVYELGEKVFTTKHYYNEELEKYVPSKLENKKFRNLSLVNGSLVAFTMPVTMPALEKEYSSYVIKNNDEYTLKVYANYDETVKVEIIYQDYQNNNYLKYVIDNYYDVKSYDNFVENELEHKITFEVIKGTRIKLPKVTLTTEGYKFDHYMNGNIEVLDGTNITVTSNTTFLVKCSYLVKFYTYGYSIQNYNISLTEQTYGYYFWQTKGNITLPTRSQVNSGARPLIGYSKANGEEIVGNSIEIDSPCGIDFIYGSSLVKLTLTTPNAKIIEKLPVGQTVIQNYTILGTNRAEFEVEYGTSVQDIKNVLPAPICDSGYTFIDYEFSENDTITKDGFVTANVLQNEYSIVIYEPNNTGVYTQKQVITKHLGESITETYTPSEIAGKTYLSLSLYQDALIKFDMLDVMSELDKEYKVATKTANKITLNVYAYYISYINVTIEAKEDCKLPQEYNLTDYSGGGMFNKEVTFKITAENIINNNITLPVPEVRNLLQYATFKGYSFEGEMVVDASGKLLDNFVYNRENITLNYEFEYNNYDFNVYAKYTNIENIFDFETTTFGFTKQVKFNELIGTLPVINLNNYTFKGYYLSDNKDLLLSDSDVKIADINGNLLDGYKTLSENYFDSLMLKNIVAKYEYDYVVVSVISNNLTLGKIERITSSDGKNLTNEIIEGGYRVKILKGTGIIVSSYVYDLIGEFDCYTIDFVVDIENARNISTKIENITEDITVTANFNYKYFNIIYMVDGKQDTTLTPNRFNVDDKVELPQNIEKSGYNFAGWYLEESLINKIDVIEKNTYTKDITVYAKFVEKSLQLNIHLSNLNNYQDVINIDVTYGKVIKNIPNLTKQGYNLVGLFTEKDRRGIKVDNNSKFIFTEDLDVYAYFELEVENTLIGDGTEYGPYQVGNFEEFKIFANLINYSNLNNSQVYFKLTNNIVLEEDIIIDNFKANINGDNYVIYSNNHIKAYKTLTALGEIQMNLGLFGENNGTISNLIMVNNANINIEDVTLLNLGNVTGLNNGSIDNIIVYYNVNINYNNDINLGDICANNENVTNYSVYNSKLTLNSVETTNNNMLDKHLHSKNISVLNVENNQYVVKTSEELAYLLTLTSIDKDVVIKNDIDLKGKIFESINYDINIISNGYIIKNLVSLNNNYVFSNVTLNSLAFEDIVDINLFNTSNFILNANKIEKTYLTFSVNNANYIIENNNGEIINSYFIANNGTFINQNNGTIVNSYVYKLEVKTEDTLNNFVKIIDETSVDEFISKVDNNIWFKDSKNIMGTGILPSMYTIGNYVVKLIYDEDKIGVMSYPNNEIYTLLVTRDSEDLIYLIGLNDYHYDLTEILVNTISNFEKLEKVEDGYLFPLYKTNEKITEVEFIASVRDVTVKYIGEVLENGETKEVGKFVLDGEEFDKIEKTVKSGTILTVEAQDTEDYYFVSWSDYEQSSTRTNEIVEDTTYVARYSKKITYRLVTNSITNLTITNLNSLFVENEDYGYTIKLKKADNINDYLPKAEDLIKPEYSFDSYYISKVDEFTYNVFLIFNEDYVNVNLVYENSKVTASLLSSEEYSQINTDLLVIKENIENVYTVLKGYTLTLKLTPNYSYITKITINGEELEYDYNSLINNSDEISFDILIDKDTEIVIEMQEILINTTFIFDENLCQLELTNALIDENNLVSSKKGTPLLFKLTILDHYTLGNFELNDAETEFEINENGEYIYIPNADGTIKINIVEKQVTIRVLYTLGGEVLTNVEDKTILETETYENGYEFSVKSGEGFKLYLINEDDYQISSIYKTSESGTQSLNAKQIVMNNIIEDLTYEIKFEKLPTWLDLDEEGEPLRFNKVRFSGAGVQTSPYIIDSKESLLTLAYNVNVLNNNYQGVYFKTKTKDMTLDFSSYYFSSIGNETTSFGGIILGNNLKLRGIRIVGNKNVGLFKTLSTSAIIKSITIEGNISGNYLTGSICGTNNGTIIGCKNSANITSENAYDNGENLLGGISAVNNGTISRTSNEGYINSCSKLTAGISAVNNGTIENIYNTGYLNITNMYNEEVVLAGICADNKGQIRYGYNDSRVNYYNNLTTCSGTTIDNGGTTTDVYYNLNKLTADLGIGKTYEELTKQESEIYQNFDFVKVWYFNSYELGLPKLQTMYEYSATINFVITFSENISAKDRFALIEVTNNVDLSYCLMANNNQKIVSLYDITEGSYTISLTTLIGNTINLNGETTITLDENSAKEITINIEIDKSKSIGYYGKVIL